MKVLVVDGDVSYPASSGKRLRTLNLLTRLAGSHNITYLARSETAETESARQHFAGHGIRAVFVIAPLAAKSGLGFYRRLATNVVSIEPYSVRLHTLPAMRRAVQVELGRETYDLCQLEWSGYLYCVDPHQVPVVLQAHNVDALLWQRYHEVEQNPFKRLYIREQYRKMARFEKSAFCAATRIVSVSSTDANEAQRRYGEQLPIDVVDNGVDCTYFGATPERTQSKNVLFLGALDWRPNQDGLDQLLSQIMPRVLQQQPASRLLVVGRNASVHLRQRLAALPWAELHADVPDVRPYLSRASVLAVPLRIGGGTRLKILEALAAGLPVVSTSVGAEGLTIQAGVHFERADDPETFSRVLANVLAAPAQARAQAAAGRELVRASYDWTRLAGLLEASWTRAIGGPARKSAEVLS